MSFSTILYTVLIQPIQLVFEIIFVIANRVVGHPALAVIVLSLSMNFLVLPLYRRADAMQEEARDIDKKLSPGIKHIKKSFSGDERMMILQTYYRQNNYSPINSLKGSVSLLLEIPFFIAAYQFLSHAAEFNGISFGPIVDLSAPDALICIGSLSINLLPILMTLINVISSALFLKGFPLKSKIQLYGMALFFLVFLYNSPSGLVFYWTLNNLFSLVKTIFYKIPNPRKVLALVSSGAGLCAAAVGIVYFGPSRPKHMLVFLFAFVLLQLPLLLPILKKHWRSFKSDCVSADNKLFVLSCLLISVLTGLLIPSSVLAASPLEFINPHYYHNPLLYILMPACFAAGSFMLWFRIFYGLANGSGKLIFGRCMFVAALLMIANYLFFGTDLGLISPSLQYEDHWELPFSSSQQLLNLSVLLIIAAIAWFFVCKKSLWARTLMLVLCLVAGSMATINTVSIQKAVSQYNFSSNSTQINSTQLKLSRDSKNVVVIMLDRFYGGLIPFMLEEKPELADEFDGFTWYPNTISFGSRTNFGSPPLFGGYEYTPVEMNKRSNELLVDKHNESLRVMPELFYNQGYDVTVCDVPYANYKSIPDMSIYDSYEGMGSYILTGMFFDEERAQGNIERNYRNFFCFSLMKCAPLFTQNMLYFNGNYNQAATPLAEHMVDETVRIGNNLSAAFIDSYYALLALPELTVLSDNPNGSFIMLNNEAPHRPSLLQLPDYTPAVSVDNRSIQQSSINAGTAVLTLESKDQIMSYHASMASLLALTNWFNELRNLGVYDNTKIIIVADHGNVYFDLDNTLFSQVSPSLDVAEYNPLLMVKDFNSTGFSVSNEFMTNADVPTLATVDVMDNPVNPFTGNEINSDEKFAHEQFITASVHWDVKTNNGTSFAPSDWFSVKDDITDPSNWAYHDDIHIFPQVD